VYQVKRGIKRSQFGGKKTRASKGVKNPPRTQKGVKKRGKPPRVRKK